MLLGLFPYFRGAVSLTHRVLTLLSVALFLGIVWFDLGAGINVPALVWHDRWFFQLAAGFSVAALFAYVWLVTYLLDSRFSPAFIRLGTRRSRALLDDQQPRSSLSAFGRWVRLAGVRVMLPVLPPAPSNRSSGDELRWYLGATLIPCTVLLLIPAFVSLSGEKWYARIVERWPFALGVVLAIVALGVSARASRWVRRKALAAGRQGAYVHENWLHTIATLLFVALAVLYSAMLLSVEANLWHPPPITAACALFGLLIGLGGAIWFNLRIWAVPILLAIIAWMVYCNLSPYKLRFPHLEAEYDAIVKQQDAVDLEDFEVPARTLKNLDGKVAEEKARGVCKLVASMQAQLDPNTGVLDRVKQLKADGLAKPENYSALVTKYEEIVKAMRSDEKKALERWKGQFKGKVPGDKPKLVVVTTTGGANRSALWTTKVLSELHADKVLAGTGFPKHVRIITGASGGMVGAAYYVASLERDGTLPGFKPDDIAQDFLTPIINGFVFREVPFLVQPRDYTRDRGELLDRAMEGDVPGIDDAVARRLKAAFTKTFHDLAKGEDEGWRPSLIFSPMIVEDGRRLLISNRHVPDLSETSGDFLLPSGATDEVPGVAAPAVASRAPKTMQQAVVKRPKTGNIDNTDIDRDTIQVYSRPAIEFFRLFPEARARLHLSTAARMNATFPFLSPAVSLPTQPPRRIVDAGYFDNTGVSLAADWLYEHADWIAGHCSGALVIQIRDSASHQENRNLSLPNYEGGAFLPGLTGPLSAVNHARTSTASYRNDDDLSKLNDYFDMRKAGKKDSQFFTTVVFERDGDVGMNWYLSEADKTNVIKSWSETANSKSLDKLRDWWKAH